MSVTLLLLLACAPDPPPPGAAEPTLDASGLEDRQGSAPGQPIPPFVPVAITLDGWTGLVDGEVVDVSEDATLFFTLWTERGWERRDRSESCTWEVSYEVLQPAVLDADDLWTAAELRLVPVESDCAGLDEDTWSEPTTALTSARVAVGFGPMSPELHRVMTAHYDRMGLGWGMVADEAFSTWFAVDDGEGFEAVEAGATWAFAWDAEAPLEALPLDEEGISDGVLSTRGATPLSPAWLNP